MIPGTVSQGEAKAGLLTPGWRDDGFRGNEGAWRPPLNAFRSERGFSVCMELAGTDPDRIHVRVEAEDLVVRGFRASPAPLRGATGVLALEIDQGPFERVFRLAAPVDAKRMSVEHHSGLLWIFLPLAEASVPA